MSAYLPHAAVAVLAALVAWALVEVARRWLLVLHRLRPRVRDAVLRTLALIVGGLAGASLGAAVPTVGGWPWGALAGVAGGGLCTVIVATVRARIRRLAGDPVAVGERYDAAIRRINTTPPDDDEERRQ